MQCMQMYESGIQDPLYTFTQTYVCRRMYADLCMQTYVCRRMYADVCTVTGAIV